MHLQCATNFSEGISEGPFRQFLWKPALLTWTYRPHNYIFFLISIGIVWFNYQTQVKMILEILTCIKNQGRIQDFKLGWAHLKLFLGVFRVKNHNFMQKNHIFSNCGGRREHFGVFRVKFHDFTPKNHIFSNFRGGCSSWICPWKYHFK